jgi:TonB-linked SusC/RagA family outer membrane protein
MKKDLKLKCLPQAVLSIKHLIVGLFLLITSASVHGQSKTVSGIVTDEQRLPIPGVSVMVKGGKIGTQTNADGQFTIQTTPNDQLIFSFIGYESKTLNIGNSSQINVTLQTSTIGLKDVVVTALGITKSKRNLTYATQTIETQDLTKARDLNVANSLSGKVAGIDISRSSSGLGGSTRVTLRGDRSINGNNQALYVVDGIPIDNSGGGPAQIGGGRDLGDGISSINPDDIDSINVLKGASATALYGSRAANGAIIITTKKGSSKKGIGVNYSLGFQMDTPNFLQESQNEFGQGNLGIYSKAAEQSWGPKLDGSQVAVWSADPANAGKTYPFYAQPNNNRDFYTTGTNLVNSLALNGGDDKTQAYFSYTNTKATGIIDNNKLNRHNINIRLGSKFGEKISLDAKVTYLNEIIDNRGRTGDTYDNVNRHVARLPRNISLDEAQDYSYINAAGFERQNFWNPNSNGGHNPYWTKYNNTSVDVRNRIMGFAALTYKILPELNLTLRSGLDKYVDDAELKWHNDTYTIAAKGNYRVEQRDVMELNNDFLFSYDKKLTDFSISANFGGNIQKNKMISSTTNNNGLVIENLFITANALAGTFERTLLEREKQSLYITTDIGYKNVTTLTLTGRNDWSSTLPKGNNSYFFSSAGINTILSDIITMPSFITFAKLRASLAQTGNDADPYNLIQTYTSAVGGNGVTIGRDARKPITNLKPEITTSQEAGMDLRFLNNRLGLEFTWFKSNSKNQLLPVSLPAASGWTSEFINAGNVENSGIELTVNGKIIKKTDLKWDLTVNYSKNNNKVIEISPTLNEFILTQGNDFMNTVKVVKGKPYGELYSRGYVRNTSGEIIVDANGLPTITSAQSVYLGNTRPSWTGSIMNKITYKNIYLSFVIGARIGGVVSSFTNANIYGDGIASETAQNRSGFVFDGVFANGTPNNKTITAEQYWTKVGGRNTPAGEVFTYSATNVRLRELVIGYSIPKSLFKKLPFQSANVSLSGRNLFFFKNNAKGFDPEMVVGTSNRSVGIEAFSPPTTRTYGVNLNLSF